jgi:hypothetical protein
MTRWLIAIMVAVAWVTTPPSRRSWLWRIPAAAGLIIVALTCWALDDLWRLVRRTLHRGRRHA